MCALVRSANRSSCCYRGRDAGCPAPPAQIRTCPLRHPAPPSGQVDGKPLARPWVSNRQLRPVGRDQLVHLLPAIAVFLRPAAKGFVPQLLQPGTESLQRAETGRDSKVIQPSVEDLSQPSSGFLHATMSPPVQLLLDAPQGTGYAFRDRLASELETSAAVPRAVVREPQKVESLRSSLPPLRRLACANRPNSMSRVLSGWTARLKHPRRSPVHP